ncbi:MAG: hypothetical protein ABIG89_03515 [Candidatus Woesearchaeota archaeon]
MIIYNPHNEKIINERVEQTEELLNQIPAKHCFISGSFLYKNKYKDIDIFVITRSEKKIGELKFDNKNIKINIIDFNDLYSLFYHSASKSCLSKGILPIKPLKATLSDYWHVINEAVPTIMNQKNKYHKDIRSLILYTEYFKNQQVLDSFQLNQKIIQFKNYKQLLEYIKEISLFIAKNKKKSYLKRFFYTQAGFYKDMQSYKAQKFLYELSLSIVKGFTHG